MGFIPTRSMRNRARRSYEELKSSIIQANKSGTGSLSNEFTTQRGLYASTSNDKPDFDNGCEVAEDATLFLARTAKFGDLGLGLYVSRQIVEARGGRVSAESDPGKGVRFRIELSRRIPPSANL